MFLHKTAPYVMTLLDAWLSFSLVPVLPTGRQCHISGLFMHEPEKQPFSDCIFTSKHFNGKDSKKMHLMELESDKKIWLQPSLKHYLAFWLDVLLGKKQHFYSIKLKLFVSSFTVAPHEATL